MFYKAYFLLKEGSKIESEDLYFEAASLLRKVITLQKDHSDANYYLGYLYENGLGVDQDFKTAFNFYSLANKFAKE